jgi:hypothetical protein
MSKTSRFVKVGLILLLLWGIFKFASPIVVKQWAKLTKTTTPYRTTLVTTRPPWCKEKGALKVERHKEGDLEWVDIDLSECVPLELFTDATKWGSWEKYFPDPQPDDHVAFWFKGSEFPTPAYKPGQIPEFPYHESRVRIFGHGHLRYVRTR